MHNRRQDEDDDEDQCPEDAGGGFSKLLNLVCVPPAKRNKPIRKPAPRCLHIIRIPHEEDVEDTAEGFFVKDVVCGDQHHKNDARMKM